MKDNDALAVSALVLAAASALVEGIQVGVATRGYSDIRPAHGFAFARLAPAGATVGELARHLGVTKQAASQMVEELARKGYVERRPHRDARARLIVLTQRGWACTRAAEDAATDTVRSWAAAIGDRRLRALRHDLARFAPAGHLRPAW